MEWPATDNTLDDLFTLVSRELAVALGVGVFLLPPVMFSECGGSILLYWILWAIVFIYSYSTLTLRYSLIKSLPHSPSSWNILKDESSESKYAHWFDSIRSQFLFSSFRHFNAVRFFDLFSSIALSAIASAGITVGCTQYLLLMWNGR
jgi:hypothetical protein